MTTLQTGVCQSNDTNNSFLIESLRFPLHSSMRIVFTGYFNGFSVEVRSLDEMALLYHMGCFGKGSASRAKPKLAQHDRSPCMMRKRQFLKRNYWYRKFGGPKTCSEANTFLKQLHELSSKIENDCKRLRRDVIDLVSSEDENSDGNGEIETMEAVSFDFDEKGDKVVIVPNSDSEDENYFASLKPKCCINRIKLQEKLMLTLQEAYFLLSGLGCLQIIWDNKVLSIKQAWDLFNETDSNFISKYIVYHYFRSKGYVVKPGIKFGGDYLLYKDGPGVNHADYIVVIKLVSSSLDWISILGHVRMATTTVKEILIAEVIKPNKDLQNLPEDLNLYTVRETLLSRSIPVTINTDE